MNHGVIEQYGTPQEIYNRPASMYVADFIGSPPMNFLRFQSGLESGATTIRLGDVPIRVPEVHAAREPGELALGVRPEHVRFSDGAPLRGAVYGSEYLGTNQIVSVETAQGMVKARVPADLNYTIGETVGLELNSDKLSLFDCASGKAVPSSLYAEARHG